MELNTPYFTTSTIIDWKHLLKSNKYKYIIIDSLKYLSDHGLINVYAFVIMPNHIHLIWEMLKMNGNEMPYASFMKFTGHSFLNEIRKNEIGKLASYQVKLQSRDHQFWQENSLSTEIYTEKVFEQKLDYIHNNPIHEKWSLANEPAEYKFSSAKFYETEIDEFGFLKYYDL